MTIKVHFFSNFKIKLSSQTGLKGTMYVLVYSYAYFGTYAGYGWWFVPRVLHPDTRPPGHGQRVGYTGIQGHDDRSIQVMVAEVKIWRFVNGIQVYRRVYRWYTRDFAKYTAVYSWYTASIQHVYVDRGVGTQGIQGVFTTLSCDEYY